MTNVVMNVVRIGFDVSQTGSGKAGCGYFAAGLVEALLERARGTSTEFLLYPTFGDFFWDDAWETKTLRPRDPAAHFHPLQRTRAEAEAFWRRPPADAAKLLGNPRIVHASNFFCPKPLPGTGIVYTVYDLNFLDHPEWTTEVNRSGCFRGLFAAALYADRFVAISTYTREHFLRVFPFVDPSRVIVAHPGNRYEARQDGVAPRAAGHLSPGRFWLAVGTLEPRKNYETLLKAYALLRSRRRETAPLAIAGGQGWMMERFQEQIDGLGLREHVHLLGYVTDEELLWLYRSSLGFVYPSLFEGFGMPVLEAMSQGAAVITSNVTSLPEVAGDAALLVNPTSGEELAQAMLLLETDPGLRERLASEGRHQAGRFTWRASADAVLDLYHELDEELRAR